MLVLYRISVCRVSVDLLIITLILPKLRSAFIYLFIYFSVVTGAWRCVNQNKNGVKDDDDSPIVIPKYDLNDIIKEETNQVYY